MKKFLLFFFLLPVYVWANGNETGWTTSPESGKRFIENKSQFDGRDWQQGSEILFGIDQNGTQVYFTKQGLSFRFDEMEKKDGEEMEREREREEKEKKEWSVEEWVEHEKEERKVRVRTDLIHLQWENANPDVEVVGTERTEDYFSYTKKSGENINFLRAYKKLIYKNLYPFIDVVYEFHPTEGIKYSLILHPGADVSQVKMKYGDAEKVSLDNQGNILVRTLMGNIIDHAPQTFYQANPRAAISSSFVKEGNEISFFLGDYDKTKIIVIDPWTQTPTLANSNGVWECERDAAGNVYIIGGCMPMKLLKYNATGTIQWTYTTPWDTANNWLGTLATDNAGNSYVTSGSVAAMQKVNNAGSLVWNKTTGGFSVDEYWTISFNCDQTKLIVGGTTGTGINLKGAIFDINTSNGNVNSTQIVGAMQGFSINECRSLSSSYNARYYYLTLDTLGCIDQNFSLCPSGNPLFEINDGYKLSYKCENYRPNNGNGGIKAIRANKNFLYTQNGSNVQKRSLTTGAVITTAAIPGGITTTSFGTDQVGNSGLDIDSCGNVYVGSANAIHKYDANLALLTSTPTSYRVSDVCVSNGGNVIVCGTTGTSASTTRTGYVQSVSLSNCDPMTLICCDANICKADPYCISDPPTTLIASSPGGTWSGTGITNTSTGLFNPAVSGTGTFTITYTLPCGSSSIQVVVNNCALPVICVEPNGDLTVSGGAGPTYQWQVQGTTQNCSACLFPALCQPPAPNCPQIVTTWTTYSSTPTATPPGTWPIRVLDASGNMVVINSLSGIPPCSIPSLNTTQVNVACAGQCTGTATVTVSSGSAPYTYSWNTTPVQTTQTATGLCAGTYSVSVTDASPNTSTTTVTITQPAVLTATASATSSSCGNGGTASVAVSGGTINYAYTWAPSGGNSSAATGLSSGNYTVTVTDAYGCTVTSTVSINAASGGTVSVNAQSILCNGDSATASAVMTGGTSPFTYSWTNGQTTSVVNVPVGNYTVIVMDANGCTTAQSVSFTQPAAITSSVSVVNTNCGASTGSASVSASGGTGAFTYSWSAGGQTTSAISNLAAGTYSCTIADANGCSQSVSGTVNNLNGPTASITAQTNNNCFGNTAGTASANATGGTSPYTYAWNTTPVQITANATGLSAGTYTVIVTDATGCTNTQTVTITQPTALAGTVTPTSATCGNSDGAATANPSGGTAPYTYAWSSSQVTQSISGLAAGNYSVTITDANGCSQSFSTVIPNANGPVAVAGATATIIQGNSAQLNASGGIMYSWSPSTGLSNPSVSNPTAAPNVTTEYCVFVTDANNCTDSTCVTIYVDGPCGEYYLPNAFSPNDDNENDQMHLYITNIKCVKDFHLSIYDRWGELVYDSVDPSAVWDGTFENTRMNTQVLTYHLYILFTDGNAVEKQGNISLVR